MANNIYPQSYPFKSLTVGELIIELQKHDPDKTVIFESPFYGAFGSGMPFSIDEVKEVTLERKEQHYPALSGIDEETGEPFTREAYTQVWKEWNGIVIR